MPRSPASEALAGVVALLSVAPAAVWAQAPRTEAITTAPVRTPLQLAVWLNGADTGLIAGFAQLRDGSLWARPGELRVLGLRSPDIPNGGEVALGSLPGVTARYVVRQQRLDLTATDAALLPTVLRGPIPPAHVKAAGAPADVGAVLNYSLVATGGQDGPHTRWSAGGLGGEFETRVFGGFGLVDNDFTLRATNEGVQAVRLDTGWTWSDVAALTTWRAGDLISGGFVWTRPLRLGGIQVERDFNLRPDLITMPSPQLAASAAVPSLADVLVNGVAVDSEAVRSGPLQIQDLPMVEGANRTDIVLRDSLGRQTVVSSGFFVTPELLRPGLLDFSLEAGFARRFYGVRAFDYDPEPAASASVRAGLSDALTLDAHAEGDPRLVNGGGAAVVRMGGAGVVSVSAAASEAQGAAGAQFGATLRAQTGPLALNALVQQTVGTYLDLGAVTGPPGVATSTLAPPRRLVQLGLSAPLAALMGGAPRGLVGGGPYLAVNLASVTPLGGPSRTVATADLRQTFQNGFAVFLNAYVDSRPRGAAGGGYLGVSMPFGIGGMADAGVRSDAGGASAFVEASHQGALTPGSLSWRMRAEGGAVDDLEGDAAYRARFGVVDANVQRLNGATQVQASFDGSLATLDRAFFASNRIDGAFAVVDTGLAHVPVSFENRPVGETDARGRLLIPYLTAYNRNAVGIDGDALPPNVIAASDREIVSPSRGAGMVVRFALRPALQGAVVTLQDGAGAPLPVGARGRIRETGAVFVVGYDGLAYLQAVDPGAAIEVTLGDGRSCSASLTETGRAKRPVRCL